MKTILSLWSNDVRLFMWNIIDIIRISCPKKKNKNERIEIVHNDRNFSLVFEGESLFISKNFFYHYLE